MARATLILDTPSQRAKAQRWAAGVPQGTRVEFKGPKRTIPQSDRMWAMLTEVAQQVVWHGKKLRADDWKLIFIDALKRSNGEVLNIVPNTDGTGFVNLSTSSSDLSKSEMSDLLEIVAEFGARNGVVFHEPEQRAA